MNQQIKLEAPLSVSRKVLEAAKHLVKTSELFKKEHIDVQGNWQCQWCGFK